MEIKSLAALGAIDERCQRFTPLGLGITRVLKQEAAAEYHQRTVDVDLAPDVLESTRKSFERLQQTHVAGILNYELFTVAEDCTLFVLEQAFAERFVAYYQGRIPLIDKAGERSFLEEIRLYDQVYNALRRGGRRVKSLKDPGRAHSFNANFRSLFEWARYEDLLHGQRFRRVQDAIVRLRNRVAHPTSYRLTSPIDSAASIHLVGEIVNRLWGFLTPGGRWFPAPTKPQIILPCWEPTTGSISSNRAEDLALWENRRDWQFIAVLAFDSDESVWYFDSDFESTLLPARYLWGPGSWQDALDWLSTFTIESQAETYLDRYFVVRVPALDKELPRNINQLAGLPQNQRHGRWMLLKADFPGDAAMHGRAIANQADGHAPGGVCKPCCVEIKASGDWYRILKVAKRLGLDVTPLSPTGIRVPSDRFRW